MHLWLFATATTFRMFTAVPFCLSIDPFSSIPNYYRLVGPSQRQTCIRNSFEWCVALFQSLTTDTWLFKLYSMEQY